MYNIRFKKNSWKINVGATTMVYIDNEVKPHNEIIKNVKKKKGGDSEKFWWRCCSCQRLDDSIIMNKHGGTVNKRLPLAESTMIN